MVVVDAPCVTQEAQGQKAPTSVQHHMGRLAATARPDGRILQQARGGHGFGQLRDVVVRGFAVAKVFRRDLKVAQSDDQRNARGLGGRAARRRCSG